MKQSYYYSIGVLLLLGVSTGTYVVVRHASVEEEVVSPLPAPIATILTAEKITVAGSQPTTLRWIADSEEFVSVNLAAESYGLGFMTKERYDALERSLLAATTPEPANNASSTLAGQTGFRVAGHACIIGFTYTDQEVSTEAALSTRDVYSIVVCSDT